MGLKILVPSDIWSRMDLLTQCASSVGEHFKSGKFARKGISRGRPGYWCRVRTSPPRD